ncbi:acyl carrier protein [Rhodopirellula sp. SWK7]|nr:acyl carrier protein [Rhodopirellula sp. SWK7]
MALCVSVLAPKLLSSWDTVPRFRGFSPESYVHLNLPFSSPPTASMTPAEIRDEIIDILEDISPDEDLDGLDDQKPFRDQLELDSMDFLDIVMELRKRHRVQIPEEDYGNLASMHSTVTYLEPKMKDI